MNSQNYLAHANDEIVVMTAVETGTAVKNLDEILQVEGLDGIFIGPMDLATSMGYFCNPSAPEVQEAIHTIEEKVFASGKFLATVAGNFEAAKKLYDRGYSMVVAFADGGTLGRVAVSYTHLDVYKRQDLNEEGMNLLQYQKSFAAACRLMTALDEAMDKVINGMGIVGR